MGFDLIAIIRAIVFRLSDRDLFRIYLKSFNLSFAHYDNVRVILTIQNFVL